MTVVPLEYFYPEETTVAGHVEGVDDTLSHKRVMRRGFGGRRSIGKTRGRWEDAVRRDAVDAKLEGGSEEERGLKEGDRGGYGPKIDRNVMGKEEEEQKFKTLFLR